VRRREWLGSQDVDERRDTDDADAIDPDAVRSDAIDPDRDRSDAIDHDSDRSDAINSDRDRSDAIDRDRNGVPNDDRRGIPTTSHDNGLHYHDVWSQSRGGGGRSRGGSSGAGRRIEQHAVGLDCLRNSRGGGHHRRDRLVVAETLRQCEDEDAGAGPPTTGRILVRPT
jgi:hypothetical protein